MVGVLFIAFLLVELLVAPEPVLAPFLLKQKTPVLVGMSNFLVACCNFSVIYCLPMWFETVELTSSAVAGELHEIQTGNCRFFFFTGMHLLPNSVAMSCGSLFAGWYMRKTGKYKMINVVFGILPTAAAVMIATLREDSDVFRKWLSIVSVSENIWFMFHCA